MADLTRKGFLRMTGAAAIPLVPLLGRVKPAAGRKPRNVVPPSINGTPIVGNVLTVTPGVWR